MIDTPPQAEEHKPDGLNVLASLLHKIESLEQTVRAHEERLNNLTLNIPDTTVNALVARTLDMHAQVLLAATRPVQSEPTPQEAEQKEEAAPTPGD
jgi:hypothetical protein